jgi:hypothetical protein
MCPNTGPEGTRVQIIGENLQNASAVLFGKAQAVFNPVSPEKLIAIVPHKVSRAIITVITPQGQNSSTSPFVVANDPRIPEEVSYKAGYVNPIPRPVGFESARLWGIAIADSRVPGSESAQVEVAWTRLSCRVDGREVVLNDDGGQVRGGLYRRQPWFVTDAHDPMPLGLLIPHRAPWCCAWGSAPIACGISGAPRRAPLSRRANSKAAPFGPGSGFLPAPCCRWEWTIGFPRPSRMALAGIITKPAPAIGISPLRCGRKSRSLMSAACNSRKNDVNGGRESPPRLDGRDARPPSHVARMKAGHAEIYRAV